MYKLSESATRIFMQLLEKMSEAIAVTFQLTHGEPLHILQLKKDVETPFGKGDVYSLFQKFLRDREIMQDPEMHFLVLDKRSIPEEMNMVFIYAMYYRQDYLGIAKSSLIMHNGKIQDEYFPALQREQSIFANSWLKTLKQCGATNCPFTIRQERKQIPPGKNHGIR